MIDDLLAALAPHGEDVRRTLLSSFADEALSERQKWSLIHAAAETLAHPRLVRAVDAQSPLSGEVRLAIKRSVAVMTMNTTYFRAVRALPPSPYAQLRAGIRMAGLTPGVSASPTDIDLWAIAVAAINGCEACLRMHEQNLRERGEAPKTIQATLKLVAGLAGLVAVLRADEARALD